MNTVALRYALEVNRTHSITKAAQNLYMGQPNLSRAIRELEKDLGITLFERTTKGVAPTEKGRLFLEKAETILSQLDELEKQYRFDAADSVHLSVAFPRVTYASYAFTRFLNTLDAPHTMNIHFKEEAPMDAVQDVLRRDTDFAIVRYQEPYYGFFRNLVEETNLVVEPLLDFRQLALLSLSHPLSSQKEVRLEDLIPYTEIVHGDYQVPAFTLADFPSSTPPTADHARKIYVYDRGSQLDLLNRMEGTYMWVSPMPPEVLEESGMVTIPCPDFDIISHDVIIYLKSKKPSELAQQCIQYMKAFCQKLPLYSLNP